MRRNILTLKEAYGYCCLYSMYGLACAPPNITWTLTGWLFCCYDKQGCIFPKELNLFERAILPCDQAAAKNIPCFASRIDDPSCYTLFAPYLCVRELCDEISTLRKAEETHDATIAAPNPFVAHEMETETRAIQPNAKDDDCGFFGCI